MKEEDIIQAANEYVGHAEEAEEDLSSYCNRKSFEAGAKWMQEKMIEKAVEWFEINADKFIVEEKGHTYFNGECYVEFKKSMKQ